MTRPSLISRISDVVRLGIRLHGIRLPFVLVHRAWLYVLRRWSGPRTFDYAGEAHRYYFHHYSLDNERVVEIALARDFLQGKTGEVLEIGNVLSHYFHFPHEVVDKYEVAPGVLNEDVVAYAPGKKYDCIISLSTLEHVGWDEQPRDPKKISQAIAHLKSLLKAGGLLFVTMPLGYNPNVDELLRTGQSGFAETGYLLRISAANRWQEAKWEAVQRVQYGTPFPCANAIFVGIHRQTV